MKWIAPLLVYLAVALGLFVFRQAWSALLGFHLAILLSLLIAKPKEPIKILVTGNRLKWSLLNILVCGSSGITLYFLWDKFGITSDLSTGVEAMGLNSSSWPAFILYFSLLNPFIEEYFWRGYLGSQTANFHISDFLYSGFHGLILINKVQPSMIAYSLAVLTLAGWFWRQVTREDNGLLAPVLGHIVADFTILMAVYLHMQ